MGGSSSLLLGTIISFEYILSEIALHLHKNDLPFDVIFSDSVAVDTEAMGLCARRDRLCLVQLCSSDGDVHLVKMEKGCYEHAENLKRLLVNDKILKIFHYARFDVGVLNHHFGIKINYIYCTKIASRVCRTYTSRHGLKNLCKDLLGIDLSKQEQMSDWGSETLSQEQMKYAASDVLYLHKLKSKLDELLKREDRMALAQECFDAVKTIATLDLIDMPLEILFNH